MLRAVRTQARKAAEEQLFARGFVRGPDEAWTGTVGLPQGGGDVAFRVQLPPAFPDTLPEVFVDRANLPRRIAHVERNGKVCIAPSTGISLDADRPEALVSTVLDRAAREVARGLRGESDPDLNVEFLAYWRTTDTKTSYSICRPDGALRTIAMVRIRGAGFLASEPVVFAESEADVADWAANLSAIVTPIGRALFVPLETPFPPPDFDVTPSVRTARALIELHMRSEDRAAFRARVDAIGLPATAVLSLPEPEPGAGRLLIGIRFPHPTGDAAKVARKGFRPGHVPTWRKLQVTGASPVESLDLRRLDREYLGARGGAAQALADKTVTVIGIGAVGAEIADALAAVGVGTLRFVDPELLEAENVHRHVLGVRHLDVGKATALRDEIGSRMPHLTLDARRARVEDIVVSEPSLILSADLIVVALGDETLERRLNRLLAGGPPRVHAWLEPLGVGGHALLCGLPGGGCFECLLVLDRELGLTNRAALTAPGQEIRRSLAGCAGTFSPYSALDARRTALEAAGLIGAALTGDEEQNVLISWRGDRSALETHGYRLSSRERVLLEGGRARIAGPDFARADCPVCGHAATTPVSVEGGGVDAVSAVSSLAATAAYHRSG
jgi:hypothetical protein